jgi:hypothetical protein
MSRASQFLGGFQATKSLYNAFTSAGYTALNGMASNFLAKVANSGAMTANTLKDLLNESGSAGYVSQLSIFSNDVTARTLRIVVIVDGTTIYDFTSASFANAQTGACLAGIVGTFSYMLPPIYYTNSIRIQYATNVNETDKFTTNLARNQVK